VTGMGKTRARPVHHRTPHRRPPVKRFLSAKQERFCVQIVAGGTATDAYRLAYGSRAKPKTVHELASHLLANPKIQTRVAALRAPVIQAAQLTLADHLDELRVIRDRGKRSRNLRVALNAEELRGKASGLYVERKEITGKGGAPLGPVYDFSQLTDEELGTAEALVEKAKR